MKLLRSGLGGAALAVAIALIVVLFLGIYALAGSEENVFYLILPCMFAGILPMTLLSYDERAKWDVTAGAMPVTRDQLVTAKYLLVPLLLWGYPGAGDAERVRQLRLRDILRVQELLKAFVHGKILRCYKSNESKVKIQVKKWVPDTGGRGGNRLENT